MILVILNSLFEWFNFKNLWKIVLEDGDKWRDLEDKEVGGSNLY